MRCPYCGGRALLRPSIYINNFRYKNNKVWVCENYPRCNTYVSCHPNSDVPEGTLAREDLRRLRVKTHRSFDRLWKNNPNLTRRKAYEWLSEQLNIDLRFCHIGMFDYKTCRKVIDLCKLNKSGLL